MKILVAEDDKIFQELVSQILEEDGYEVVTAENGLIAWQILKESGADIAILDVNMPEMDGFTLLQKIRNDDELKQMPVLMLTVRAFDDDKAQGYNIGADDYLTKPFKKNILLARIKVLERRIIKKRDSSL